jgi:amidophosphoribosyltransferase
VEEIRASLCADSLAYLSQAGLLAAVDDREERRYCTACFTGKYPVAVSHSEDWQLPLFEKVQG